MLRRREDDATTRILRCYQSWFHFLAFYTLVEAVHSFTSCAPPRFDVFSEKVIASWHAPDSATVQVAEEVMRSCGGAVQGVREIPFASCVYLNRADDGFVFFDCGTYTLGPVTLSETSSPSFTTSLALSTNSRVLLSCSLDANEKRAQSQIAASRLYRVSFGHDGSSLRPEDFRVNVAEPSCNDIFWQKQLQCFMSSPGQSWALQRVKWEQKGMEETSPDFEAANALQAWGNVAQLARDTNVNDNFVVLTMGVWCAETKCAKAVVREYNENRMLVRVALQTGMLLQDS
jgi:hypothetical protein